VLEYLHNHPRIQSKTLFATHYHELTELADTLPRLKNLYVEIAEEGSELLFLYKIREGSAHKSYGVYAARLAGLPRPVVRRAEVLLNEYESGMEGNRNTEAYSQSQAHPSSHSELTRAILETDPNALSPVEALMKLFELRRLAEKDDTTIRAIKTA
jgi:DNA mismatch repair protein MutS